MDKNNESITTNNITKSVLALSVVIALLIGLIGGYFFGESQATNKYEKLISSGVYTTDSSGNNSSTNSDSSSDTSADSSSNDDVYSSIDYSKIKINDNYTVENFYSDDETRYYASNLIGQTVPDIQWVDSAGTTHSTKDYVTGQYMLEFFSSTCTYCNQTISEIDAYRESSGNSIISLCFDTGDLSNFNKTGEHAWAMTNTSDSNVTNFLANVPWIPTILYIDNGVVELVTYGATTQSEFATNWNVAFGN